MALFNSLMPFALVKPARFERQSARPYEASGWRAEGTTLLFILMEEQS
jgi:hypothetical protein